MGLTDNLFTRKTVGSAMRPSKPVVTDGQQRRLVNHKKPEKHHSVTWHEPSSSLTITVENMATRYVLEEIGLTATSGQPNTSSVSLPVRKICDKPGYPKCICHRDSCVVTCVNLRCNWMGVGRVRRLCTLHPSVTFLLDLPQCPQCRCDVREISDRPRPLVYKTNEEDI